MKFIMKRTRWIAAGAALAWFFDPQQGARRRAQVEAQARSLMAKVRVESGATRSPTSSDSMWTEPVPTGPPAADPTIVRRAG